MTAPEAVLAAGALCWRTSKSGKLKVLVVRRPQHSDVSLPKGKLDPGETLPETAVREIAEETGLIVGLGAPLGVVEYDLPNSRRKQVYYWSTEVTDAARANSTFKPNAEISELEWVGLDKARRILSYPHDVELVDRFAELAELGRARTFAVIALRHGKAVPREDWNGPDATRTLLPRGEAQAASIAHAIAAYRPELLVTSTAVRCVCTIRPTARVTGLPVRQTPDLSQDAWEDGTEQVAEVVAEAVAARRTTVLCSHGPVLPAILESVGALAGSADLRRLVRASALGTGEIAVVHLVTDARADEDRVVAVEVHRPNV